MVWSGLVVSWFLPGFCVSRKRVKKGFWVVMTCSPWDATRVVAGPRISISPRDRLSLASGPVRLVSRLHLLTRQPVAKPVTPFEIS